MYTDYWGLQLKPFENTPDPRFLFASEAHEEGLSRLLYAVEEGKPAGLLTGTFGCGKTLLAYTLFSRLNPNIYQTALVAHPNMKPVELLRAIARALGAEGLPEKLSEMSSDHFHEVIEKLLRNNIKDGKRNLVIIDEAHAISDLDVFEELRMLLNYQTAEKTLLTLFLMGQPELREKIQKNKQFLQRIPMAFHLEALKLEEVPAYIETRLKVAGAQRKIFTPKAMAGIAQNSGGIPRRINHICDLCLMLGMHAKASTVEPPLMEEALRTAWGGVMPLAAVLTLLHQRTGYDFRGYRKSTLQRRIERRLHACACSTLAAYLAYLRKYPVEYKALFKDLTIHVTDFFRDPEIWGRVKKIVWPSLLGKEISVWSAGCATGEEAYSLAILFAEANPEAAVSILGTDIVRDSLKKAKAGIYPAEKLKFLAPLIREKYFQPLQKKCRVGAELKTGVRFQWSDLVRANAAGPFDLIVCRNVLIYFSRELQEKTLLRFYRSLAEGGFLWLGRAESLWGRPQKLFECVDKTAKIFQKKS